MRPLLLSILFPLALALICGCKARAKFQPTWLPQSAKVVYSIEYEGKARVKLKARATESEFAAAVKALGVVPYAKDKEYSEHLDDLSWKKGPDLQWDPSPSPEGTLVSHHYNWWEVVKYENGFLYYEMLDTEGP
jgi:hypothetical protein